MVTRRDFLEMEASLWLNEKSRVTLKVGCLPYEYAVGKQPSYSWLILGKKDVKLMMMMIMMFSCSGTDVQPQRDEGSGTWTRAADS